ncbi:MAG TPA: XRE family transcriptional regulator [Candidatus Nanopelagicales bacterium]|nr:XRE family transcriptional regulator [Candidatus Nanopelagicales bacterium]
MKDEEKIGAERGAPSRGRLAQEDAELLRRARQSARLSREQMARLLDIGVDDLTRLEDGVETVSPSLLNRYAQRFGLRVDRFMAGEAADAPATFLFRYLNDHPDPRALSEMGAYPVLGDFLRTARDIADLRGLLGEPREADSLLDDLSRCGRLTRPLDALSEGELIEETRWLARAVRSKLKLETRPIDSMLDLMVRQLGVELLWVGPDDLDPDIDAACTLVPIPAILVNLVGGAECWWRTRMTLAHEFCHLLFDRSLLDPEHPGALFLFSPREERARGGRHPRIRLPGRLEQVERRANIFAANLLAPEEGVRELVGDLDPTSEHAVTLVCQHYQIGRTTAINRLQVTFSLSRADRQLMLDRTTTDRLPEAHPDRVAPARGLRSDHLLDLASRALAAGRISRAGARGVLGIPMSEPLPEHPSLSDEQRAPLRTREDLARAAALRQPERC